MLHFKLEFLVDTCFIMCKLHTISKFKIHLVRLSSAQLPPPQIIIWFFLFLIFSINFFYAFLVDILIFFIILIINTLLSFLYVNLKNQKKK